MTTIPAHDEPQPPVCPRCKGRGYFRSDAPVGDPLFGKAIPCPCQEPARRVQRVQAAQALSDLDYSDPTIRAQTFKTWDQRTLPEALSAAIRFAEQPQGWLFLGGPFGVGKTHLMLAIAQALWANGTPALYTLTPRLLTRLRDSYDRKRAWERGAPGAADDDGRDLSLERKLRRLEQAPVLLLDDYGSQNATGWADEQLFMLLDYRYRYQRPTVIASNYHPSDAEVWDPRLASRVLDRARNRVVVMKGADYRQRGGQEG